VFKYIAMIFEEKYPELHEEVRYLIDRNIEKRSSTKKGRPSSWYQYILDQDLDEVMAAMKELRE